MKKVIRPQQKIKNIDQVYDHNNWAVVEVSESDRVKEGTYEICPVCLMPHKLPEDQVKNLKG